MSSVALQVVLEDGQGRWKLLGPEMMSVLKRGNSKFWYIQFQFKGKTYIRSSKTSDKRAAEQMEREMRRELHAQAYLGQRERISIRDALDQFCESRKGTSNHRNLVTHTRTLHRFLRTNRYLDELSSEDIERLKRDRWDPKNHHL